ncbi:MAG: hypothetical protein AB8I08_16920, partial [Sandaracinaceae bacterium]
TLQCWGGNQYGQLGDGTTEGRSRPAVVEGVHDVTSVHAGRHTCAVGEHTLCWGENRYGELYDGTFDAHPRPHETSIEGPIDTHAVTTCSLLGSGAVQCCGRVPDPSYWER